MLWSPHRFDALATLSPREIARFQALGEAPVSHRKGARIRAQGDPARGIYLMIDGWVASSLILANGARLIQKIHLAGDILGTPSMVLDRSADTLTALTDAVTAFVPEDRIGALLTHEPRLAAVFLMAVQAERLVLMDMLATKGHSSAAEQFAMFLLDLHARLTPLGLVHDDTFDLPLTQEAIGGVLGITSVHTNRTIRDLKAQRLIERRGRAVRLVDPDALRRLAPLPERTLRHDPAWLPRAE